MRWIIGMGIMAGLAGCTAPGATADAPCYIQKTAFHGDDQNPLVRMEMLNVGQSCGIVLSLDAVPSTTGAIVALPAHGRAVVRRTAQGALADYTPARGFFGTDSFSATLGRGGNVTTINVTVKAPG